MSLPKTLSYISFTLMLAAAGAAFYWKKTTDLADADGVDFIQAGPFQIAVSVDPLKPRAGKNQIRIEIRDAKDIPVSGADVRAVAEMPAMGAMPAMRAVADFHESSPGIFTGEIELAMVGSWPLVVDVSTGHDRHVDLAFDMSTNRKGLRLKSAPQPSDTAYYTCAMHPSVRGAAPGNCPICGMDLQPVSHDELQSGSIMVDSSRRQSIGIKTGTVERQAFTLPIHLHGQVTYDETRLRDISLRFDGWIGDLDADFEGKQVKRGELLFTVYSPELLAVQDEYLRARRRGDALEQAARRRLLLWGLSEEQIDWLVEQQKAQDYIPIFSPVSGVVIQKNIVPGSAFEKGDNLLRIADLSQVWIEAHAYEDQLPLLHKGMPAKVRLTNVYHEEISATLTQIDPFLNHSNRSARLRVTLPNTDGELRPGLFADIILSAELGNLLVVPRDAVLISGKKRIVFRDLGQGRLEPVQVRTGYGDSDRIVIRSGLQAGDKIITSGVFLIAAESRLKSGAQQW
ncbi:efflux RND transporter periplasmic adaptor subunit [Microbulbifer sp. OS29]|uniref:Efflux RND transporter periplasmic adaptor subunit n=1 Tax=Microbulbifer okhotskensis TaxID=2926617 RepID=A0A9X2ENU1_9GAMM|nr:efflux RND transporter periplasmic adaptor subunit [Microbulbifer okhotskensis]MCO1335659.1 efflux RND transporter periplasmic adaptor subunit [Microbulbifer okhotskensis]